MTERFDRRQDPECDPLFEDIQLEFNITYENNGDTARETEASRGSSLVIDFFLKRFLPFMRTLMHFTGKALRVTFITIRDASRITWILLASLTSLIISALGRALVSGKKILIVFAHRLSVSLPPLAGRIRFLGVRICRLLAYQAIHRKVSAFTQITSRQEARLSDIAASFIVRLDAHLDKIDYHAGKMVSAFAQMVIRQEARLSDAAACLVARLDAHLDKTAECTICKVAAAERRYRIRRNATKRWLLLHKKRILAGAWATVVALAAIGIFIGSITAYEYMYNGKVLGIVKSPEDVYKTVDAIGDKLSYEYGAEIIIDKTENLSFRKVIGLNLPIDSRDQVLNTFTYLSDMNAVAYAIVLEGQTIAVLDSKKRAEGILTQIKDRYVKKNAQTEYKSVGFAEEVSVEKIETKIRNIQQEDQVLDYMLTGAVEKKIYEVQSGDTFNEIAKDHGLKPSELAASNPEVRPERLHVGQQLMLTQIRPMVTVQTREVSTYIAQLDYEISYEDTSTLFKGEQTVKSRGIPGEQQVVAEIIRENGTEVSRSQISSVQLKEPKTQVVLRGTKDPPPLIGTGTYQYPTRGTLTSRFGTRWGRMHYGIDIAAPTGTKIRAADGGKVIYAGWDGSLGYVVRIDHGGNQVSVYGHCSKMLVSKGDKVYQGQHIANVGNTGRSTGPHVHFEIRVNGTAKNPLKYLN